MADRPILFSAPMVRALLAGTKTQTRRRLKPQPIAATDNESGHQWCEENECTAVPFVHEGEALIWILSKPKIQPGDRLWVREAWHAARCLNRTKPRDIPRDADIEYAATARSYAEIGLKGKLRPSMFMPRWASRITLIVTDVRVQRLQDISEAEAIAEGIEQDSDGWVDYLMPSTQCCASAIDSYRTLWTAINGPGSWEANPWVAAYTFRVIKANIDQVPT